MRFSKLVLQVFSTILCSIQTISAQCNLPNLDFGPDTTLCIGSTLNLNANPDNLPGIMVIWNNGSTNSSRMITGPGTYYAQIRTTGSNLITNGDFELGNSDFITDLTVGTGSQWGLLGNDGTYAISTNASLVHQNFANCFNHTPAPGQNMMIINGATTANQKTWCQNVSVQANSSYQLGAWFSSVVNSMNVPNLVFEIDNIPVGATFTPNSNTCDWQQYAQNWTATQTTSVEFCIRNNNTSEDGNDFMIDDISFNELCFSADTIVVDYLPAIQVNLGPDQNLCVGEALVLDAGNPNLQHLWNDMSTSQTLSVSTSGTYYVEVSNQGACAVTDTVHVIFHGLVSAGLDQAATYCQTYGTIDLNVEFNLNATNGNWQFAGTGNTIPNSQLNTQNLLGIQSLLYIMSSTYCPSDSAEITVTVNPQNSSGLDSTQSICNLTSTLVDLNTLLRQNSLLTQWDNFNLVPEFDSTTGLLATEGLMAGTYQFYALTSNLEPCINDTAVIEIRVVQTPVVDFSVLYEEGCEPLLNTFADLSTNLSQETYQWSFSNGLTSTLKDPFDVLFAHDGCYDVSLVVTNEGLCSSTLSKSSLFCVNPLPTADFSFSPHQIFSDNPNVHFQNLSVGAIHYNWDFSDGFTSTMPSPSHLFEFDTPGIYAVSLIAISDKGCTDTSYQNIPVLEQIIYYVPNAFTPDQDNNNPIFLPIISAGVDLHSYHLEIFNRWGELLFESYDSSIGWDGSYGNQICPDGLYTWMIQFKSKFNAESFVLNGMVAIIK